MVGWHHQLNGHEFEQTVGDSDGQGSLACYSPRGHKESDTTEWLNNTSNCKSDELRVKFYELWASSFYFKMSTKLLIHHMTVVRIKQDGKKKKTTTVLYWLLGISFQ